MNVNGYQDFLNKFGNDNVTEFNNLKNCALTLHKLCNCQKQRKIAKSEECNKIYINLVNSTIGNLLDYLRTKTEDSEIIFSSSSHELKRFKLR